MTPPLTNMWLMCIRSWSAISAKGFAWNARNSRRMQWNWILWIYHQPRWISHQPWPDQGHPGVSPRPTNITDFSEDITKTTVPWDASWGQATYFCRRTAIKPHSGTPKKFCHPFPYLPPPHIRAFAPEWHRAPPPPPPPHIRAFAPRVAQSGPPGRWKCHIRKPASPEHLQQNCLWSATTNCGEPSSSPGPCYREMEQIWYLHRNWGPQKLPD